MTVKRRHFLMFLGAGAGSIALQPLLQAGQQGSNGLQLAPASAQSAPGRIKFQPVKGPMPLPTDGISATKQLSDYSAYAIQDDVVVPQGYTYDVIASWGDAMGDSHFGYNNDYLSLVETAPGEGYLTVNFEYISPLAWMKGYEQVLGKTLPFDAVLAAVEAAGDDGIEAFGLPASDGVKQQIVEISKAALTDLGIGVIFVRREANGRWVRVPNASDRRITGISGLDDNRYLKASGPAVAVFRKTSGTGYIDGLGDKIIGTFGNCSGGTTPWGTVLSAEENFQDLVPEPVYADGTPFEPAKRTFSLSDEEIAGHGSALGLAGHKYGWMVEVDPAKSDDYGVKHTWLGRFRHEAVAVRAEAGRKLAVYSGCDRRSGHVYKFVSADAIRDPKAKSNSRLMENGMLYAAKFNADGTGQWIALSPETAINPDLPSVHVGGMITLPNRPDGGVKKVTDDAEIAAFKQQFKTLGDLYEGNAFEKQGAILIDAHFAANAVGATCTARPEDTDLNANGSVFIAFTSGAPSGSDGGPDKRVFKAPTGEEQWEYGWIMRLDEDGNDPAAMTFKWAILANGGEPHDGGLGFANPDNLEIDSNGNLWIVTDMSSDKLNRAVPQGRVDSEGKAVSQSNLRGLYGNNSIWVMPTTGENAGEAYLFGFGPMDAEMTGPFVTKDTKTIFFAAQHPGEYGGVRENMASETRQFALKTLDGQDFVQTREVPIGSNWPSKAANQPPKPSVVAIRRLDGGTLL